MRNVFVFPLMLIAFIATIVLGVGWWGDSKTRAPKPEPALVVTEKQTNPPPAQKPAESVVPRVPPVSPDKAKDPPPARVEISPLPGPRDDSKSTPGPATVATERRPDTPPAQKPSETPIPKVPPVSPELVIKTPSQVESPPSPVPPPQPKQTTPPPPADPPKVVVPTPTILNPPAKKVTPSPSDEAAAIPEQRTECFEFEGKFYLDHRLTKFCDGSPAYVIQISGDADGEGSNDTSHATQWHDSRRESTCFEFEGKPYLDHRLTNFCDGSPAYRIVVPEPHREVGSPWDPESPSAGSLRRGSRTCARPQVQHQRGVRVRGGYPPWVSTGYHPAIVRRR